MSKEITYTIISEDYNPKYTQFTLKENQTYYLLGENGIGKSTLIDLFGGETRMHSREKDELALDVSFDVSINSQDLLKQLSKNKDFNERELKDVLKDWKEEEFTIRYGSFHDNPDNEQYNQIEKKLDYILGKKNQQAINQKLFELHEGIKQLIKITNNYIKKMDEYLNKTTSRLNHFTEDKGWKTRNTVAVKQTILKLHNQLKDKAEKVSEFIEAEKEKTEERFSDLKNIRSLIDFYYRSFNMVETPVISSQDIKNIAKKIDKMDSLIYEILNFVGTQGRYTRNIWVLNRAIAELSISFDEKIDFADKMIRDANFYWSRDSQQNNIKIIAEEFNYKINQEKGIVNQDGGPLSKGQKILSHAFCATLEQKNHGKVFDEPFIFLDETNIPKMKQYINKISGTKLITTHDKTTIDADEIQNTILMFKDNEGKRCIANFHKFSKIEEEFDTTAINGQIQHSLITWAMKYQNEKILIVEGHTDFEMLRSFIPKEIKIIPIGGTLSIDMALNFFSKHFKNIFYLMDNDNEGKIAQKKIEINMGSEINITNEIFELTKNRNLVTMEQLLSGKNSGKKKSLIKQAIENDSDIKKQIIKILKEKFVLK